VYLLFEFKLGEVFHELLILDIELEPSHVEDKHVGGTSHIVLVRADLTGACFVVCNLIRNVFFPVLVQTSMFNVEHHWTHFLNVLTDQSLVARLLVLELGHGYLRAKEVLVDSVGVLGEFFRFDGVACVQDCMLVETFFEEGTGAILSKMMFIIIFTSILRSHEGSVDDGCSAVETRVKFRRLLSEAFFDSLDQIQ